MSKLPVTKLTKVVQGRHPVKCNLCEEEMTLAANMKRHLWAKHTQEMLDRGRKILN